MSIIHNYCITGKNFNFLNNLNINIILAGSENKNLSEFPPNWIKDNDGVNISNKNKNSNVFIEKVIYENNYINFTLKFNIPILILTKGLSIYDNNYEVLAHKMERLFKKNGIKEINISAAGGPCLAKELANKVNTSVVFANENIDVVEQISKLVSTDYYHIYTSNDVIGVETCAAIKNIFSMAVGASQGLCDSTKSKEKNYLNTAAALIQESIYEMITFVEKLKGKKETVIGLAGIGDLYVSADGGRNSKMGEYLGQGMTFNEAKKKKMFNVTVEGADLALEIGEKIKKDFNSKTLPLMISMIDTICEEKPLKVDWKNFK